MTVHKFESDVLPVKMAQDLYPNFQVIWVYHPGLYFFNEFARLFGEVSPFLISLHTEDDVSSILGLFLVFTFLTFLLLFGTAVVIWSLWNGITPMPSSKKAKNAILSCIPKEKAGKIYELGSGWGTLIIPLAKHNPQSQVIGFETSPIPYFASLVRAKISGVKNLCIQRKDFHRVSLEDATCIVCYLFPNAMNQLKEKMERELKEGVAVISNTFAVPGWTPRQTIEIKDFYQSKVYFYTL